MREVVGPRVEGFIIVSRVRVTTEFTVEGILLKVMLVVLTVQGDGAQAPTLP